MEKVLYKILAILIFLLLIGASNQENKKELTEKAIDDLLAKMTIEEKVGQMTQISIDIISIRPKEEDTLSLLSDKMKEAILKYKVGSILNTGGAANSVEKWHEIINAIQDAATKESRLKIPVLYGIDAIHGANYTSGATLLPQSIAMAASRNLELMEKGAYITAYETRASGIPWNFNPVLEIGREPLWPRFWETFGEDVYLASEMGKAHVKGQQGDDFSQDDRVASCLKHYLAYSVPKNGLDRTPIHLSERMIREIYLPPFEEAIKQGAMTVMVNSSEINGIPVHSDYHLLTEILKEELDFQGFVVSDWQDVKRLHTRDRVADTPKEAVRMAVMAGIDMSMVPDDYSFYELLVELVAEGAVPVSRIDDAVRRILRVKFMTGIMEKPYPNKKLLEKFASKEFEDVNLSAAHEVITLLKNENILPLKKEMKVLVTGPTANKLSVLNGGWSYTWQGNNESLYPQEELTILEAIQAKIGEANVKYFEGVTFTDDVNSAEALKNIDDVDVVIFCAGEPTYCETPGNITDLYLSETQLDYAKEITAKGKPVVMVLVEGRPRVINKIVDDMEGIVLAYLPGMEGGRAITDVLFGDVNPSGKLPYTYPNSVNGYSTYDYKPLEYFDTNYITTQWDFGFGLSYTSFELSDLQIDKKEITTEDKIKVKVNVKNTGKIAGKEVVELYLTDLYGTVSRPNKQLKGFEKVLLAPGEIKTIEFEIDKSALSFIGREDKRIIEPGDFEITIGELKSKFTLK